ncbi:MAG TPA: hypothetical protein GXX14_09630 [Clostridiaceae bacterium]|nr:hypothetical protein [Clostridiaceae bacterium]
MFTRSRVSAQKGSITVEAAIVIPVVILSIVVVIYIVLIMYQKAYMQAVADDAASRGAAAWDKSASSLETIRVEKENLGDRGLYWRIYDPEKTSRQKAVEEYLDRKYGRYGILRESSRWSMAELKDYIIYKKLVVTMENSYRLPIGGLLSMFGIDGYFTIKAKSEAVVNEPVEFIRNIDFLIDMERKLERRFPALKNLGDRTREIMGEIKDKIFELFR